MKSYYIESIDLWVLVINSVIDEKTRNTIAESFKRKSDKIHDVVVVDATVAPIEIIPNRKTVPFLERQQNVDMTGFAA